MELIKKKIEDLIPADYNPRNIQEESLNGLKSTINRFGLLQPIIWNERSGNIVGGHQRLKVLLGNNEKTTEVVKVDLDEIEEKALNVALNNQHIQGEWEPSKLNLILSELKLEFPEYEELKLDSLELELPDLEPEKEITEDEVPCVPEIPITCKGDLWLLGEHRLLCGDSTNVIDVEKLMDGKKADMVLTDPPYGVSYIGKTKDSLTIQNDSLDDNDLTNLVLNCFDIAESISRPGAYWYATVPAGPLHIIFAEDWKKTKNT